MKIHQTQVKFYTGRHSWDTTPSANYQNTVSSKYTRPHICKTILFSLSLAFFSSAVLHCLYVQFLWHSPILETLLACPAVALSATMLLVCVKKIHKKTKQNK